MSCPLCHKQDMVQKVSVIIEAGSSSHYSYMGGGRSQTELAAKLESQRPRKPEVKGAWGCFSCLAALVLVGTAVFGSIGFLTVENSSLGKDSPGLYRADLAIYGSMVVFAILVCTLLAIAKARKSAVHKRNYQADLVHWDHDRKLWNTLYYCARDDVVFSSDMPHKAVSSAQIRKLVHRVP